MRLALLLVLACGGSEPPPAPAPPPAPPTKVDTMHTIQREADIAGHHGELVRVEGTLGRTSLGKKGTPGPSATTIRLADDAVVIVTYGDPPAGWEAFMDQPVAVEAKIWPGPPPGSKQAVGAPHVTDWGTPARR